MKKLFFCCRMPKNSYVGGVAVIIKQYLDSKENFENEKFSVELLDMNKVNSSNKFVKATKLKEIISVFLQRKYIKKQLSGFNDAVLHIHSSRHWTLLKDMFIARSIRKVFEGKMVLSIHFAEIDKILYKNKLLAKYQFNTIKNVFDKVIFLSKETQREFIEAGVNEAKTKVLYTFHNFEYDAPIVSDDKKPIELLFVGSIDSRKGIIDLLNVLKNIDKNAYKLHICGQLTDNAIKEEYETLLGELGDNAIFHGYVSGQQKEEIFKNADVLVLPSYGEGMPIVIMEALAAGCGVISTTVGAIPEIILKENGCLITPGDREALETAIVSFINDRTNLNNIKFKNYEYGKSFNLKNNIRQLCDIYEEKI